MGNKSSRKSQKNPFSKDTFSKFKKLPKSICNYESHLPYTNPLAWCKIASIYYVQDTISKPHIKKISTILNCWIRQCQIYNKTPHEIVILMSTDPISLYTS